MSDLYIRPLFLRGEGELKHKLYIACENGNLQDAKRFIDEGAQPLDTILLFQRGQQKYQCQPLLAAIQKQSIDLIDYLARERQVAPHLSIYEESDGENEDTVQKFDGVLLMLSSLDFNDDMELLEHAVTQAKSDNVLDAPVTYDNFGDQDHDDWQGLTYLQFFARAKNTAACKLLLKHGADYKLKTKSGRTSLDLWPELKDIIDESQ
jgi:ankyrin repeat protein